MALLRKVNPGLPFWITWIMKLSVDNS